MSNFKVELGEKVRVISTGDVGCVYCRIEFFQDKPTLRENVYGILTCNGEITALESNIEEINHD